MTEPKRGGGDWKEWSQHVLLEIQRLSEKQEKMSDILVENTKQLEIHIEGVKLAREQNDYLRKDSDNRFEKLEHDIEPIKEHVHYVNVAFKFWTKIAAVVVGFPACIYYIVSIYLKLKG